MISKRENYVKTRTPEGKVSYRSNDPVSEALDGLSLEEKIMIAAKCTDTDAVEIEASVSHLNKGMKTMAVTGKIRGAVRRDEKKRDTEDFADILGTVNDMASKYRARRVEAAEEAA